MNEWKFLKTNNPIQLLKASMQNGGCSKLRKKNNSLQSESFYDLARRSGMCLKYIEGRLAMSSLKVLSKAISIEVFNLPMSPQTATTACIVVSSQNQY